MEPHRVVSFLVLRLLPGGIVNMWGQVPAFIEGWKGSGRKAVVWIVCVSPARFRQTVFPQAPGIHTVVFRIGVGWALIKIQLVVHGAVLCDARQYKPPHWPGIKAMRGSGA